MLKHKHWSVCEKQKQKPTQFYSPVDIPVDTVAGNPLPKAATTSHQVYCTLETELA